MSPHESAQVLMSPHKTARKEIFGTNFLSELFNLKIFQK